MPFALPRTVNPGEDTAAVLAFGKLSVLEACTRLGESLLRAESPCERVAVLRLRPSGDARLPELAGVHKYGPLMAESDGSGAGVGALAEALAPHFDKIRNVSLSGYDISNQDYDSIVRLLLDGLKRSGFSKVHLLRPKGNELLAAKVLSREVLDILAFPYHGGIGLAPTAWVSDSAAFRERGVAKPAPRSEISMSPRLAKILLNLAGLQRGQTVLDPFCGSGTVLAEALLGSYHCIGFDSSAARVKDARKNLSWVTGGVKGAHYEVKVGDARYLSRLLDRAKVDAVVTEPLLLPSFNARPRTQTAEELIGENEQVYADALTSMAEVLAPGGRIVVVVPVVLTMEGEEVSIALEGRPLGLKQYQPGPVGFEYPVRPSFESTRWVRRAVYVFESPY